MKPILILFCSVFFLASCVETAILASTVTAVSSANDPRTIGKQVDDSSIEVSASYKMTLDEGIRKHTNINAISYNGRVLLVGQAPNQFLIDKIVNLIREIEGVSKVHNQIKLGTPATFSSKAQDVWITTKVKSQLLTDDEIEGHNIKVVTENQEVYLMGQVSPAHADKAAKVAASVSGVVRVIKVF